VDLPETPYPFGFLLVVRIHHYTGLPVVVQFEKFPKDCHSEARDCRARNLLFRCRRQANSSPIKLASE
jgi:hypothetical protein